MTSTVSSLAPAHAVILVEHEGDISTSDMRQVATQMRDHLGDTRPLRVLSDFSAATNLPPLLDILNLIDVLGDEVGQEFRQAFIWPKELGARIELDALKTGEQNRGLQAKAFGDRDSALAWLES